MPAAEHPRWPELSWADAVDRIAPLVYRVYAGDYVGTAFVISVLRDAVDGKHGAILATALHVLEPAARNRQDVELVSVDRATRFATPRDDMHVQPLGESAHDTILLLLRSDRPIARFDQLLPMLPDETMLARGAKVGWVGFPGAFEPELCFFHGHISGYRYDPPTYLVDGIALGGVSGGPAFDSRGHLVGLVSSYIPNRIDRTTTLPGVLALVPINHILMFMREVMRADIL